MRSIYASAVTAGRVKIPGDGEANHLHEHPAGDGVGTGRVRAVAGPSDEHGGRRVTLGGEEPQPVMLLGSERSLRSAQRLTETIRGRA